MEVWGVSVYTLAQHAWEVTDQLAIASIYANAIGSSKNNMLTGRFMNQVIYAAAVYRAGYPNITRGIVLVCDNQVVGWRETLRNPLDVKLGSLAVDECGRVWEAVDYDGYQGL